MVTSEDYPQRVGGTYSVVTTYFGLSTDEKPTGATVGNGSCFLEMDTSKIYFYDADGAEWQEWGGLT